MAQAGGEDAHQPAEALVGVAPPGSDPSVGDIAYYAPWGNLAIYYRDFGYSDGLVILGRIDGGVEAIAATGTVSATIELAD